LDIRRAIAGLHRCTGVNIEIPLQSFPSLSSYAGKIWVNLK